MGNIMRLVLQNAGFQVVDKTELGATDVVRKALGNRRSGYVPEYTGNGNWFFSPNNYGDAWYSRRER